MSCVESWNEWDPLREVLLGTLEGKVVTPNDEPGTRRKCQNYGKYRYPLSNRADDNFAHAEQLVDNYAEILKGEGIAIRRPTPFDFSQSVSTPIFNAKSSSGATCPRDVFFLAGKHLIEAPMSWRCRYFEHYAWRNVMLDYFNRDESLRWSCTPKPMMQDSSFNEDPSQPSIGNDEILFDAADTRRFGKDVFVQTAHTANERGFEWIRRTLRADGLRVHRFTFKDDPPSFSHIDAKVTPIDEDTLLWTSAETPSKEIFELFKENEWKLVEMPARKTCCTEEDMTGPGIHLNMLVISPSRVLVEASEAPLIKTLRDEGVDCVPVPFAHVYPYGGGLNCFTLDVLRDGRMQSYFPTLDLEEERKMDSPLADSSTRCSTSEE